MQSRYPTEAISRSLLDYLSTGKYPWDFSYELPNDEYEEEVKNTTASHDNARNLLNMEYHPASISTTLLNYLSTGKNPWDYSYDVPEEQLNKEMHNILGFSQIPTGENLQEMLGTYLPLGEAIEPLMIKLGKILSPNIGNAIAERSKFYDPLDKIRERLQEIFGHDDKENHNEREA
jgi:hypothetical protein